MTTPKHLNGDERRGARLVRLANARRDLLGVTKALVALLQAGVKSPLVVVSGLEGGEGGSTIAWNVAQAAAQEFSGRVCLLRVEDEAGGAAEPSYPETDAASNLVVATLSRRDLNTALNEGLRENMPRFDVAPMLWIVDGPPLLTSLEAYRLCGEADGVVLVVEAERTTSAALDAARALMEGCRGRLLGAVLNKRRRRLPAFVTGLFGGEFRVHAVTLGARQPGPPGALP